MPNTGERSPFLDKVRAVKSPLGAALGITKREGG